MHGGKAIAKAFGRSRFPTASSDLFRRVSEETRPAPPPTIAQLQSSFLRGVESALDPLVLPIPAQLVSYEVSTSPVEPLRIQVIYLSETQWQIQPDRSVLKTGTETKPIIQLKTNVRLPYNSSASTPLDTLKGELSP